jgi:anthranilate phosphoribosyltransferase
MTFQEAIEILSAKKSLTFSQAYELFKKIATEPFDEAEVEAFLKALKEKGESWEEIAGAVKAYREVMNKVPHNLPSDAIIVDTCGTGGDAKGTFNFSTAVALALSKVDGIYVAKHGNRSITSRCGSADIISALGIPLNLPPEVLARALEEVRFVFLFAPSFHPAFAKVAEIRKRVGRSIFNILGPLLNPAGANYQLLGVFDFLLPEKIALALESLGAKRALVVWGEGGYDEVTITGSTKVSELRDGVVTTYYLDPEDFGFERCEEEDKLKVSGPDDAIEKLKALFEKRLEGPIRDMFVLNLGCALYLCEKSIDVKGGIKLAKKMLEEGGLWEHVMFLVEYFKKLKN